MAKKKFTFTHEDGRVETRSSERQYTHVVVACENLAQQRAGVLSEAFAKDHGKSWNYIHKMATTPVGQPWSHHGFLITEEDHVRYGAQLEDHPTRQGYIDTKRAEALARIDAIGGEKGKPAVQQWSMSAANAAKGISAASKWCVDVKVMPVDPQ